MMKISVAVAFFALVLGLVSCQPLSPDQYFAKTVLGANMIVGFAGDGQLRELEQPSAMMASNGETVPMKRKQAIDDKIIWLEDNLAKVKDLKQTDDTREMIQAAIRLHEYVLPVYKNEYQQLASLYDQGSAKENTQAAAPLLHEKYFAGFDERMNNLLSYGKTYAEKHDIKVNWDVRTSPN